MAFTLQHIPNGSTNYPAIVDANWTAIEAEINSLLATIAATSGDGPLLTLQEFDRDGIVGAASYQLDEPAYGGGPTIKIGRRPTANVLLGDVDQSFAWLTVGGVKHLVSQVGDVTLNAGAIVSGLPKTIYVGVPSGGTAQLFEDTTSLNVLYIYSMCWDGFNLTCLERIAPILPGYTTHQALANNARMVQVYDGETDFLRETDGRIDVVLPGSSDDNGIGVDGAYEVVGLMVTAHRNDVDGLYAPFGAAPDNQITFEVRDDAGQRWNLEDMVFDAAAVPDSLFAHVNTPVIGDDRFALELTLLRLVRTQVGASVVSAVGFTLTVFVRPIIGAPIGKDETKVDLL